MSRLRVFAIGGWLSYRALFGWLNPYLFVIILLVPSVTQILFFAYLGRAAGVEDDSFYVVGNAVVAAAVPGLFGMADTITDERHTHTLSLLVVSPAHQSAGIGRSLLQNTLDYGRDSAAGVILASEDARALRAYSRAGFDLRPAMDARGKLALTRQRLL